MALQGIFYFALVLIAEAGIFTRIWASMNSRSRSSSVGSTSDLRLSRQSSLGHTDDSDVAEEKARITDTPIDTLLQTDSIVLKVSES